MIAHSPRRRQNANGTGNPQEKTSFHAQLMEINGTKIIPFPARLKLARVKFLVDFEMSDMCSFWPIPAA